MKSLMSSKIYLHLIENRIDTIRFYPKPDGKTIPMKELIPENTKLKGFTWRESERPKNPEDLYTKRVEKDSIQTKVKSGTKAGTSVNKKTEVKTIKKDAPPIKAEKSKTESPAKSPAKKKSPFKRKSTVKK